MTGVFAFRMEIWKAAMADDQTRLKLNLASDREEMQDILIDFARKHGYRIMELPEKKV